MARKAIDLHCDTLMKVAKSGNLDENEKAHVSLRGLQEGGVALQCFADFVPTGVFPKPIRKVAVNMMFNKFYKNYKNMMAYHSDTLFPVLSKADLDKCGKDVRIGVLLTIEDGGVLGEKIENVEKYYNKGVRLVTLTWNHRNRYGCSAKIDQTEGLTRDGVEFVRSCEEKSILLDASHLSDAGFYDLLRCAKRPFTASHSNSRALCPHFRNLTDEMFREIVDMDGVVGMNLNPGFLRIDGGINGAEIEDVVRHIEHFLDLGGENTICMGADWDGISSLPHGMTSVASVTLIRDALAARGYDERLLDRIFYDNLAGFVSRWL